MSKYQVKVGVEFEVTVVETLPEAKEVPQPSLFTDWKLFSILAVFVLIFSSGAYAAISGNNSLYDKLLDVAGKVAEHPHGKK